MPTPEKVTQYLLLQIDGVGCVGAVLVAIIDVLLLLLLLVTIR